MSRDALFQQAPISIVQVATDGTILAVNAMVLRVSGYGEDELVGRPFYDFLHPDDRAAARADLATLVSGVARHYESERRYVLESGAEMPVLERVVLIRPEPPAAPYCLSVLHDLTLRHGLLESLSAHEARLRLALEAGQMGTWELDLRTGQRRPSPEMGRLHGVPADQLRDAEDYVTTFVHPDDRERVRVAVNTGILNLTGHEIEYRVVWPDGTVRWLLGKGRPFTNAEGRPIRLSGICIDVTARRQAQQRERLAADVGTVLGSVLEPRRALAMLADLVVPEFADWCAVDMVTDEPEIERVAVAHRDPAKVALGLEVGRRWPVRLGEPAGIAHIVRTRQSAFVPQMVDEGLREVARDADHLAALRSLGLRSAIIVPLVARDRVVGVLSMIMAESGRVYDESDWRLAEQLGARAATAVDNARLYQEAEEARRGSEDFIARVSHELRTPLTAISGWTSMLRGTTDPGAATRGLDVVQRNVKTLTRLIEDLLDFARSTREGLTLDLQEADVSEIVSGAVQSVQPLADAKGVSLVVDAATPCVLAVDPVRVQQVVWNLLANALGATGSGGRIATRVRPAGLGAEIVVRDTGEGISPAMLTSMFEPFRQRSGRRSRGLGLGLAITRQIVEAHGGTITAHSEGAGAGAVFTVTLPRRMREQSR